MQDTPNLRLDEAKAGDWVELDGGFTCHGPGKVQLRQDEDGLYFICNDGHHYIDGQADDGYYCIGIYPCP